jgi:hypothetical protein
LAAEAVVAAIAEIVAAGAAVVGGATVTKQAFSQNNLTEPRLFAPGAASLAEQRCQPARLPVRSSSIRQASSQTAFALPAGKATLKPFPFSM